MKSDRSTANKAVRWLAGFLPMNVRTRIKDRLDAMRNARLKLAVSALLGNTSKRRALAAVAIEFTRRAENELGQRDDGKSRIDAVDRLSRELRGLVRQVAGLPVAVPHPPSVRDLMLEAAFLQANQSLLRPIFNLLSAKRVLYAGQSYYNAWYLSRALRGLGWKADVLNWNTRADAQIYFHGEDFKFRGDSPNELAENLDFYIGAIYGYDIFHFTGAHAICFGNPIQNVFVHNLGRHSEIYLLKELGKKIAYSNNGCLDGVSQTSFGKWGSVPICSICVWRNHPSVCSDKRNLAWGKFRNAVADFQCQHGGNRVDYNDDPRVLEVPEFFCLDKEFWNPHLEIPEASRLPPSLSGTVWLYHAVGHRDTRTDKEGVNIKSSHIYLPLVRKLKEEGLPVELLSPTGVPNKEVRLLQAQADIFLDMLTFGWFGANVREALMLGKPVVCYLRPEWLKSVGEEMPEYVAELPIISATPDTVEGILRELVANSAMRREVGRRSREFAVKWYSAEAGGRRLDELYGKLLRGEPVVRNVVVKQQECA